MPIKNYLPDFPGGDPMDPSDSPKLWRLADAGKAASLLAFIGSLAALAYHILL